MAGPPDDDMLREAARARGFRLVKSRRRKPGGDFGRYGLTGLDSGRECLGFGEGGLTATADEVLAYLRGGEVASWKRSLIGVVADAPSQMAPARPERSRGASKEAQLPKKEPAAQAPQAKKQPPSKPNRHPRESGGPASSSVPERKKEKLDSRFRGNDGNEELSSPSAPPPTIREASRRDAAALAKLLDIPAATLAERLAAAIRADEPPLLAERDGGPVGLIAWTITATLQHGPRGRITLLIVSEGERRQGIGTRLLAQAEQRLQDAGVTTAELDLDIDFDTPTAFLRRTGYTRTTNGYGKSL